MSSESGTTSTPLVVGIDGPSGSGKSSTSRGVAERLGLAYLDTGAMYRAATWLVLDRGVDRTDQQAIIDLVSSSPVEVTTDPNDFAISIDGTDVTEAIREPRISAAVSTVASIPDVRKDLIVRQQAVIADATRGIVVEGRDITTVVAPEAPVRLLLVADPDARVARRQAELGADVDQAAVVDQVIRRDRDDSAVTTFTEAADGVQEIDSTHLSLDQVIDAICALVEQRTT